jgi:hypothetical protein
MMVATEEEMEAASEGERPQALYSQMASLRRGLHAQTTILEHLETQMARDRRAI